jgi:hypothetical protein
MIRPVLKMRVLSPTSPSVLAPRPVWGPRCGRMGTQAGATRIFMMQGEPKTHDD